MSNYKSRPLNASFKINLIKNNEKDTSTFGIGAVKMKNAEGQEEDIYTITGELSQVNEEVEVRGVNRMNIGSSFYGLRAVVRMPKTLKERIEKEAREWYQTARNDGDYNPLIGIEFKVPFIPNPTKMESINPSDSMASKNVIFLVGEDNYVGITYGDIIRTAESLKEETDRAFELTKKAKDNYWANIWPVRMANRISQLANTDIGELTSAALGKKKKEKTK
ncbi:hypothetical protein H6G33_09870 [Calothrix sp. FACHB-1219]|uniref:hypothetical protein n=1 Tax=unclassified Calothrix TaxID=2619626 RepID=UPI0016885C91|nr:MULTISPECIES: hypothetical protein [unclassified Calothrix]MBD2201653.1 hypothetical protein [Calothrix sp. FACHB-168]MBD2217339.1 hypothetical protein [Calothrix sp. FACHB-1219]